MVRNRERPGRWPDRRGRPGGQCGPHVRKIASMTEITVDQDDFLGHGRFIDSDAPTVVAFAREAAAGAADDTDRVLRLFGAVRDGIRYDPYVDMGDPANFRASSVLAAGRGFCIGKAALLAAGARALGVPARVGYADVRNDLTSARMYDYIKSDVLVRRSYADLLLDGRWIKATPAFDLVLCQKVGLQPLNFD